MDDDKVCSSCKRRQPLTQYSRSTRAKDGRQPRCRSCARAWYEANREVHKANAARRTREVREQYHQRLLALLSSKACVDCGEDDVVVLEFDHRQREVKVREVARLLSDLVAWEKIEAEIAKCDVCCANCHRRRTAQRADQRRHKHQRVRQAESTAAARERLAALLG